MNDTLLSGAGNTAHSTKDSGDARGGGGLRRSLGPKTHTPRASSFFHTTESAVGSPLPTAEGKRSGSRSHTTTDPEARSFLLSLGAAVQKGGAK